jgi:hypothetical protein
MTNTPKQYEYSYQDSQAGHHHGYLLKPPGDCGKAGSRVSLERGGKPTRAVLTASNILNHDAGH